VGEIQRQQQDIIEGLCVTEATQWPGVEQKLASAKSGVFIASYMV
jgi:hypothetical protein